MPGMVRKSGSGITLFPDLGAVIFLIAVVGWFNFEIVFSGKVTFFRDLGPIFYPMRFSLAQSFQQGEIPLWDRHMAMGFPLLANFQSGVFYPPHLFFLFLPFFVAIRVLFVFHYLAVAIGAYFLCRRWGYSWSLALVGAILFAFGGYTVSLSSMLSYFQTVVWLPWVLLLGERLIGSRSMKAFILFTFVLLVQLLAGAPEIYAMGQGLLFLDGLRLRPPGVELSYRRLIFLLLATNLLVVGLAMVQILPTAELFLESRALDTISYQQSAAFSFHPLRLLNLFFLDKEVDYGAVRGLKLFFSSEVPLIISLYIGTIALPAIYLWFAQSSLKEKTVLLGLMMTILVIAMGEHTPLYPFLFHHVAFFRVIRYPEKIFFLNYVLFLYILLTGLFRSMESDRSLPKNSFPILMLIWTLVFLLYLFLRFHTAPLVRFIAQTTQAPIFSMPTVDKTFSALVHLEIFIALTLGTIILLYFCKRSAASASFFKGLLVLLVFVDLSSAHRPYHYLLEPGFVYNSPKILSAPDADHNRLFHYPEQPDLHPTQYSFFEKKPSFAQSQVLLFANLFPTTGVFYGFDYVQDLDSLKRRPYVVFLAFAERLSPEGQYRLLGSLNVKYLSSFHPLPETGIALLHHFPENSSWLYGMNRVVPRVYLVSRASSEIDPVKVLARLASRGFDPREEVILERPMPFPGGGHFDARAKILHYGSRNVKIEASLSRAGVLVLADSFYPGWRVFVDGKEQEVLRANLFFRAVALSAGEHLVEFRYQPLSFAIGLSISLLTFCGMIVWCSVFSQRPCSIRTTGIHGDDLPSVKLTSRQIKDVL